MPDVSVFKLTSSFSFLSLNAGPPTSIFLAHHSDYFVGIHLLSPPTFDIRLSRLTHSGLSGRRSIAKVVRSGPSLPFLPHSQPPIGRLKSSLLSRSFSSSRSLTVTVSWSGR